MSIDLSEYKRISTIIFLSFFINTVFILALHNKFISEFIICHFGGYSAEIIKQFFYGALGATISCSIFLKMDKEANEDQYFNRDEPDPSKFRLPDSIDRRLYIQRILTSGFLAILGVLIILAGFTYLDINLTGEFTFKHILLFTISSLLIGIYQSKFFGIIERIFDRIFKSNSETENTSNRDK